MKIIKKSELEKKYYSMKTVDIAKDLDISVPTLICYLKKVGIKLKGKGKRGKIIVVNDSNIDKKQDEAL